MPKLLKLKKGHILRIKIDDINFAYCVFIGNGYLGFFDLLSDEEISILDIIKNELLFVAHANLNYNPDKHLWSIIGLVENRLDIDYSKVGWFFRTDVFSRKILKYHFLTQDKTFDITKEQIKDLDVDLMLPVSQLISKFNYLILGEVWPFSLRSKQIAFSNLNLLEK